PGIAPASGSPGSARGPSPPLSPPGEACERAPPDRESGRPHRSYGHRRRTPGRLAADGPGTGAGLRVEERGAVVLLRFRGSGGIAGAAYGFPGAVVELVLAAVAAVGGDGGRVAAGLAGADRVEGGLRDAARKAFESFPLFAALAQEALMAGDADTV